MRMLGPVRVVGREALLGWDIEASEEAHGLITVEVVDMASTPFVQELQGQQAEHRAHRGDHLRSGVTGLGNEVVEAEPDQQRQEDEEAGDAAAHASSRSEVQLTTIGHSGCFRASRGLSWLIFYSIFVRSIVCTT